MEISNFILLVADIFPIITAFGYATNGVKKRKIIKFGLIGWCTALLVGLFLSFTKIGFLIFAMAFETLFIFVVSYLIFSRIVFRGLIDKN